MGSILRRAQRSCNSHESPDDLSMKSSRGCEFQALLPLWAAAASQEHHRITHHEQRSSPLVLPTNQISMERSMMPRYHKQNKPDFDDSCRSGATHLDFSTSDRSEFDGVDFFDARSKLPSRSCLAVKTQHDSLRRLATPEHTQATPSRERASFRRSSTNSSVSFDKVICRNYDGD